MAGCLRTYVTSYVRTYVDKWEVGKLDGDELFFPRRFSRLKSIGLIMPLRNFQVDVHYNAIEQLSHWTHVTPRYNRTQHPGPEPNGRSQSRCHGQSRGRSLGQKTGPKPGPKIRCLLRFNWRTWLRAHLPIASEDLSIRSQQFRG